MPGDLSYTESWLNGISPSSLAPSKYGQGSESQKLSHLFLSSIDTSGELSPSASVCEQQPWPFCKVQLQTPERSTLKRSLDNNEDIGSNSPRKRQRPVTSDADSVSQLSEYAIPPRSSSPTKVRAKSPVRELREIYKFATPPLVFSPSLDSTTPQPVLRLIKSLPLDGVGVIPGSFKDRIQSRYPYENVPEYAFTTTTTTPTTYDETIWNLTTKVLAKAQEYFIENQPEAPWVALATEMLEGVFAQPELKGMLSVKDIQFSDINSTTLLPQVHNSALPTKKADLAIALSNNNSDVRATYYQIRSADPTIQLSQMSETSVSRLTLPGCVEVGEPGKSYLEASLQLGVWCFAGLQKLRELHRRALLADTFENNFLLFGWTAVGVDWKLHISYIKENGGVNVLGPLDSGGPKGVLQAFIFYRVAEMLAKWVLNDFWPEFKRIFENR